MRKLQSRHRRQRADSPAAATVSPLQSMGRPINEYGGMEGRTVVS